MKNNSRSKYLCLLLLSTACLFSTSASAIPAFARQYNVSCTTCHAAFPRLNSFGQDFIANNYRLPNWKETTLSTGDDMLALPKTIPLAMRAQAYTEIRQTSDMDPATGTVANKASWDFQSPYLVKLLSSAPLSDHITYYFYGILAEKGENGKAFVEDAWVSHDDVFGSGIAMQLGQFQVSDLMFPRETRLTVQDFLPYSMAGITYERGVIFSRDIGPVGLSLGAVNGNGIDSNYPANSAGYQRPGTQFDNNNSKSLFGRIGMDIGPVRTGLFALNGKQPSAGAVVGTTGTRETSKRVLGLDFSGDDGKLYWYGQLLWNRWNNFLDASPDINRSWTGGFVGADYIYSERWVYSMLYNRASAKDFRGTGTVYEGIALNTLSTTATYYFMRNVKGFVEATVDLQKKDNDADFVGHETKENSLMLGFDLAF
ncbi:MAG: hypothetical protein Q7S51_03825 [Gallionellaceae bacterium]|nr:hypothetical protein [Gallionellaceae bacterium]